MTLCLWSFGRKGAAVAFLAALGTTALVSANDPLTVKFVNEHPTKTIDLYWENHSVDEDHPDSRKIEASIPPRGAWHQSQTFNGHEFSYEVDGERHYVKPAAGNANGEQFMIIAGSADGIRVRCDITVKAQLLMDSLDILVKPYWAPRGAARFLELVRDKYYDGVVFHRVVPDFLAQFGIARDSAKRAKEREVKISDDTTKGVKFEPGRISFVGEGHDSRGTEIFVVMPGAPTDLTEKFGAESWETPFAMIDGDVNKSALTKIYSEYGDMPPFGNGPDSSKMYKADGYTTYLSKQFPQLDYIDHCYIVDEIRDHLSRGEL